MDSAPSDTRPPVLAARDVDLVRNDRTLLSGITVTVRAGEQWALLGPNGAGKSTLLRILASYAHPTRGQVDILGRRLGRVNVFELRPQIGYVTPHHPLTSARTVTEVILTGATGTIEIAARWAPSPDELARADQLARLLGLKRVADQRWPVLSQGERGRTLIARALMARPRILLLDEPAAGLDIGGREQLLESLASLRDSQPDLATVLVTHHLEELPPSISHALLLRDGRALAAGPAAGVLTTELVSTCFDYPVAIARNAGRWASVARAAT
ncbi:MAG TPA: ATP-binding cassette domain-containing protein [Streptosporangiaceae bacterium]|nr:ATP-binding cassette domain-containing protein [Streptosporangiaceae bacterium]